MVGGATLVAVLFTYAARAMSENRAAAWVTTSVAGFAVFIAYTFAVALPHIKSVWPAQRIAEAVEPLRSCIPGPVSVLGFREPSAVFLLGERGDSEPGGIAQRMAEGTPGIAVVEDRWQPDLEQALAQHSAMRPPRTDCVTAFNTMRGCPLAFSIYLTGPQGDDAGCRVAPRDACATPFSEPGAATVSSRCR